jgi:small subunit ribosomal protein S6
MRKYETVFISDPDLQEQPREELFDKVRNIISKEKGLILKFDDWGNKKLAYEIKKKFRGHYVCITYGGTGEVVNELERNMRLSDDILKFMTIVLSENTTEEALQAEHQEEESADESVESTDSVEEETPVETAEDSETAEETEPSEDTADEPQKATE